MTVTRIPALTYLRAVIPRNPGCRQGRPTAHGWQRSRQSETEKRESSAHFGAVRRHSHRSAILATMVPRWQQVAWRWRPMKLRQGREQALPQLLQSARPAKGPQPATSQRQTQRSQIAALPRQAMELQLRRRKWPGRSAQDAPSSSDGHDPRPRRPTNQRPSGLCTR
jgi:hypothetical protein